MEIIAIVVIGLVTVFILLTLSKVLDSKIDKDYVANVHVFLPWSCDEWEQIPLKASDFPDACIKVEEAVHKYYPDCTSFIVHDIKPALWKRS